MTLALKTKHLENLCFIDFEFFNTKEKDLELVSCALSYTGKSGNLIEETFWLLDNTASKKLLATLLSKLALTHVFVAYAFQAEARCLFQLSSGLSPTKLKAVDLYLEYRMLLNHNHEYQYGKQLIRGKEKTTFPPKPKYARTEEETLGDNHKPEYGLAAACYKLLGETVDTDEKTRMRDIIISGDREAINNNLGDILRYNASDIKYLPMLLDKFLEIHSQSVISYQPFHQGAFLRADASARAAKMEMVGYPVNRTWLDKFTHNIPAILNEAAEVCLEEAPEVSAFEQNKKTGLYSVKQKPIRDWIEKQGITNWMRTDKDALSLSVDAFRKHFDTSTPGFAGAYLRYLKTNQSLNGFKPIKVSNTKRRSFYDHLGKDNRARAYLGLYGSQSARYQPGATGFIPLKAHWMRAFIQPPKGRAIVSIDYASQEFFIAALLSGDERMIEAYLSGDPYLAFAILSGLAPKGSTKDSHPKERELTKALVLGMSYEMGAEGLARRLSLAGGRLVTREEAEAYIERFYSIFYVYAEWKSQLLTEYKNESYLQLPCGWTMGKDNDNFRSVGNFPIQGFGSSVLRRAIAIAQENGLKIIFPLHDALYAETDIDQLDKAILTLAGAMRKAFRHYFTDDIQPRASIRLDGFCWGEGLKGRDTLSIPKYDLEVSFDDLYIDGKGRKDFDRYSKYFV